MIYYDGVSKEKADSGKASVFLPREPLWTLGVGLTLMEGKPPS